MVVPGFQIMERLHESGLYRATNLSDDAPVLLKRLATRKNDVRIFKRNKNDYLVSVGLEGGGKCVLKPFEYNDSIESAYVAYDYFEGIPLCSLLEEKPFDALNAVKIALRLLEALDEIHRNGVAHRNLSSQCVLVNPRTFEVKLLDFHFSGSSYPATDSFSEWEPFELSLQYVSPEMTGRVGNEIDYRTDYYSLGVLLYEMLCGELPFEAYESFELIHSHIARQPSPPTEANPSNCPRQLSDVVMKLMEKMPVNRYQSITGIRHDLNCCLESLKEGRVPAPFPLGQRDFSTRLTIPSELYGRSREVAMLEEHVDKLSEGEGCFVSVRGVSGSGKTSLVKFVANSRIDKALFLFGKCEQYDTLLPYSAFARIIEMLVSNVLSENKAVFESSKSKIVAALGSHAATIVDLFPAFKRIAGPQEKPLSLGVSETKNRLKAAVATLFKEVGSKELPLVLVFDDMQWVDQASLSLLATLVQDDLLDNTLVIGCYRDDENEANPELLELLERLSSQKGSAEIAIGNLELKDVARLTEETFRMEPSENEALSHHVYHLCRGNPFYIRQYLRNLYQDGEILADPEKRKWYWQPRSNEAEPDSTSVIEQIEESLSALSKDQLDILKYGAFLGSRFTLWDLSCIAEISEEEIVRTLSPLIVKGLLVNNGDELRFKHDRVQQAIASFVGGKEAKSVFLRMGSVLNSRLSEGEKNIRLFEIANYFIKGEDLLETEEDFQELVQLLYRSGIKALESSAYNLAFFYSDKCSDLLAKCSESFRQENDFETRILLGRSQYLTARHDKAQKSFDQVLKQASSFDEKCRCYSAYKDILVSEVGDYQRAVAIGMQVLKEGVPDFVDLFGEREMARHLQQLRERIEDISEGKTPEQLLDHPRMKNPDIERLVGLLVDLWEAAYYAADERLSSYCARQSLVLSLEYGNCSESAFSYVLYGMDLVSEGRYKEGYAYGRLALDLNERFEDRVMLPKVTNLFCNYINFFTQPFSSSVALYENSSAVGRENGDYLFGLWATYFVIWTRFLSGQTLHEVSVRAESLKSFVSQTHDSKMIYAYRLLANVVESLQCDEGDAPERFKEDEISLNYWKENGFTAGVAWRALLMGQYHCLMGDYEKAYDLLDDCKSKMSLWIVMFPYSQHGFYYALSLMKLIQRGWFEADESSLEKIDSIIDQLHELAELCPGNFLYQERLLEAERYRLKGEKWAAGIKYSEAFEAAESSLLRPAMAICSEMAADFWADAGNNPLADYWMLSAYESYAIWGASAKAFRIFETLGPRETKKIGTSPFSQQSETEASPVLVRGESIDSQSVVRFTRAISEEIDDDKLFKKTMEIVIENAGADKGAILVLESGELRVRAVGEYRETFCVESLNVPLEEYRELPKRIIYYVERAKEQIIVDDAMNNESIRYSEYIKNKESHSVLCMPIVYKDELRAILYLENSSTAGAFSAERAEILRILLIQASISKQNADLYKALETELEFRKETSEKLRKSEDKLRLSHEYASIAVWDWNIETGAIEIGSNGYAMLGYKESEVNPTIDLFWEILHPDDFPAVRRAVNEALQEDKPYSVEFRVRCPDGIERWFYSGGGAARDESGAPIRMLGVMREISDRKHREKERLELEKQLFQAQKMEAIGQLAGGIAHDFNNMLSVILGSAEMVKEELQERGDYELEEYLDNIIISGTRASDLTSQMLLLSRRNAADIQRIDPINIVKDVIRMFKATFPSSIDISLKSYHNVPEITANPAQLTQSLMNLCINARDAMDGQGSIVIRVKHSEFPEQACSSCHNNFSGRYVEISISDTGGGIAREIRDSIFNPFFTTKKIGQGTGMGLSMVHGIMHEHKGHLILDVEEGVGSCFKLLFQVAQGQESILDIEETVDWNAILSKPYRALVVDDEPGLAKTVSSVLEKSGCSVTVCTDSSEAMKLIERELDQYDVMITDQTMPHVSGSELAVRAMEINPDFPVVLCTGFSAHLNERKSAELGIRKLLRKPVPRLELLKSVEEAVSGKK